MVNKLTTVNRSVLHTSHPKITHLAVITRKTNIKIYILKGGGGGGGGKEPVGILIQNLRWNGGSHSAGVSCW